MVSAEWALEDFARAARRAAARRRAARLSVMKSALYTGWIRHRRFGPARERVPLPAVHELPRPRRAAARCSTAAGSGRRAARRSPGSAARISSATRRRAARRRGARPGATSAPARGRAGPIRLLTHLRFFGYSFNPVSFYYCFDAPDSRVETIVAEITNTPWKERHAYVLPVTGAARRGARAWRFSFDKQFHVSPFMPMDMRYEWCFSAPGEGLHVHMENWRGRARRRVRRHAQSAARADDGRRRWRVRSSSFPLMTAAGQSRSSTGRR